jgi:hypothetical protein
MGLLESCQFGEKTVELAIGHDRIRFDVVEAVGTMQQRTKFLDSRERKQWSLIVEL